MTREQAKHEIDSLDYYLQNHTDDYSEESHTAMMMAISALSAEPCDDCISRQVAIVQLSHNKNGNDDCDVIIQKDIETIKALPSVENKGEWIAQDIHNCCTVFKCSKCGYEHNFFHLYGKPTADYSYCPDCGARMKGGE